MRDRNVIIVGNTRSGILQAVDIIKRDYGHDLLFLHEPSVDVFIDNTFEFQNLQYYVPNPINSFEFMCFNKNIDEFLNTTNLEFLVDSRVYPEMSTRFVAFGIRKSDELHYLYSRMNNPLIIYIDAEKEDYPYSLFDRSIIKYYIKFDNIESSTQKSIETIIALEAGEYCE